FRGDFLEGLDLDLCPEYQAWCLAEREELKTLHCRILRHLVAQLTSQPEQALPRVRILVNLEPFDEAARAMLVRLLAATGRRDEAEQHYELSKRALADLGSPTSGELERAKRELRDSAPVSRSADTFSGSALAAAPSAAMRGSIRSSLSGGSIGE